MRDHVPGAHVVIASSREIFGAARAEPPARGHAVPAGSPYGVAKLAAHQLVGLLRERDGLHLSSAILFNHESPRRQPQFLSRKVTARRGRDQPRAPGRADARRPRRRARLVGRARHRARACG